MQIDSIPSNYPDICSRSLSHVVGYLYPSLFGSEHSSSRALYNRSLADGQIIPANRFRGSTDFPELFTHPMDLSSLLLILRCLQRNVLSPELNVTWFLWRSTNPSPSSPRHLIRVSNHNDIFILRTYQGKINLPRDRMIECYCMFSKSNSKVE